MSENKIESVDGFDSHLQHIGNIVNYLDGLQMGEVGKFDKGEDQELKNNFIVLNDNQIQLEFLLKILMDLREELLYIKNMGIEGPAGKDGKPGKDGLPGKDGKDGAPGRDLLFNNLSESEKASLRGTDGRPGPAGRDGKDGAPGKDGKPFTQDMFTSQQLAALVGPPGANGKDGFNGIDGINGKDGKDGTNGIDGKDGLPGRDGIDGKDGLPGRDGIDGKDGKDATLDFINILDIKDHRLDQLQIRIDGGSGFVPETENPENPETENPETEGPETEGPENELYQPPSITMYKGDNQIKIVLPDSINGNYILTLPQVSGTILTNNSVIDNLVSSETDIPLSANQGRVLKNSIDNIDTLLTSDDTTLDTLQEVVDFIKINKSTLSALTIDSIAGLGDALASKLDKNQNAVSASKLATARTIGGVSFDGTANINLPGVNTAGNQNTTGNSATASKLATPVKINNKLFDGSTNINLEEDAMVVKEKVVNLTGGDIQTSLGSVFIKTITEDTTLSLTTNYNIGETNSFILELTNGGNYTINWWSDVKWDGGVAPELTNNGKDILGFYSYGSPRVTIGVVLSKDAK